MNLFPTKNQIKINLRSIELHNFSTRKKALKKNLFPTTNQSVV